MNGPALSRRKHRVAVVSGGTSGIGRAFVVELLSRGYRLYTCGRNEDRLRQMEAEHPDLCVVACDLTDRAQVARLAALVGASQQGVDLLVANAGGSREIDLRRLDACADPLLDMHQNFDTTVHLIAEFLPLLRSASPSRIILLGSGYGLVGSSRVPLYSASKAAIHSLASTLRTSLSPERIGVTEVCPPVVDTPSVATRKVAKMRPEAVVRAALEGAARDKATVYPGKARFLPYLVRLAPSLAQRIVSRS